MTSTGTAGSLSRAGSSDCKRSKTRLRTGVLVSRYRALAARRRGQGQGTAVTIMLVTLT
jgi:hypothetical protein